MGPTRRLSALVALGIQSGRHLFSGRPLVHNHVHGQADGSCLGLGDDQMLVLGIRHGLDGEPVGRWTTWPVAHLGYGTKAPARALDDLFTLEAGEDGEHGAVEPAR
jgi:hypothetical protein